MTLAAIIQARISSKRLPGKVLKSINGTPMIVYMLSRVALSKKLDHIIVAIPNGSEDDDLYNLLADLGVYTYRGSTLDVLSRYYYAASHYNVSTIVRLTSDCPLVDPCLVDDIIDFYHISGSDYVSNCNPPTFPDGLDVEVFSFDLLSRAHKSSTDKLDREHVTPWMTRCCNCTSSNYSNHSDTSHLRITVDEPEDLLVASSIAQHFHPSISFTTYDIEQLSIVKPHIFSLNSHITRNQGRFMSDGQKLWERAKKVIPGGNMLLSKRSEMFLPSKWPSYYSKTEGCKVWDLDGNMYYDLSIMGIGTNLLGYNYHYVDAKVHQVVQYGNLCTLNCPEEVYLAEELCSLHPWAEMVKLARSGGEAIAISVRIARAATGRDNVAICGYHGWHDWYIATNLGSESGLTEHLLPGLEPNGVPQGLRGTVHPFSYNNLDQLRSIVKNNQLAAVVMEVQRSDQPKPGFLEGVRSICSDNGIVLIFDECTSGFRETFGGLHLKYGVEPDMAMFGKCLGNGYAITAVIGRESVMQYAQSTFISSTFWTERIGPTAALATLQCMHDLKSWQVVTNTGLLLQSHWRSLEAKYNLGLTISGIPALSSFTVTSFNHALSKTYITQEMLKRGFLAANSLYVSVAHSPEILDLYLNALDEVLSSLTNFANDDILKEHLESPVCHTGFKRLN